MEKPLYKIENTSSSNVLVYICLGLMRARLSVAQEKQEQQSTDTKEGTEEVTKNRCQSAGLTITRKEKMTSKTSKKQPVFLTASTQSHGSAQ